MKYILALDQGTTNVRALLIDKSGRIAFIEEKEVLPTYPHTGWVEQDAMELIRAQMDVIDKVLAFSKDIAGIGITNQRETTIVWDRKTGMPIYPAIVWQDRRTSHACEMLQGDGLEGLIKAKTGLLLDPYFSATKLHWILENVSGARERANNGELAFGTVDSFLLWHLTGGKVHKTDITNASRTLLFNIRDGKWDEELLELFAIPHTLLPEVCSSSEIFGMMDDIPIAGIAGDQQAALFGQRCLKKGEGIVTYGTGCFLLMHLGTELLIPEKKLITTVAAQVGDEISYALEGSVFMGGALFQWLRDGLKVVKSAKEADKKGGSVSDSGGVYFVPAFTGLGAPHWDPHAKGAIFGLTRGTTDAHLIRAAFEGIAFQVDDTLKLMQEMAQLQINALSVDGGAAKSDLLMQIQADISRIKLNRSASLEQTALGVGYLAGLATNFWSEKDLICKEEREFSPKASIERSGWEHALKCTMQWSER